MVSQSNVDQITKERIANAASPLGNKKEKLPEAHVRNVRIAPRKLRLIVDLVRGKSVEEALQILKVARKRGVPVIEKLILSAKANAVNNIGLSENNLTVGQIYVNEGVTLKRVRPRARGRADRLSKRTSHAHVVLAEK